MDDGRPAGRRHPDVGGQFGVCFWVSYRILSKRQFLWEWWDFAFLPIPPRSIADLERDFWQIVNLFNNPSWVVTPLGVFTSSFVALGLFVAGAVAMGWRWRGGVYLLLAPIAFTLTASALRQYPFHGRLLLFLIPSVHLLVAEGAATITRRGGPFATFALARSCLPSLPGARSGTNWSCRVVMVHSTRTATSGLIFLTTLIGVPARPSASTDAMSEPHSLRVNVLRFVGGRGGRHLGLSRQSFVRDHRGPRGGATFL